MSLYCFYREFSRVALKRFKIHQKAVTEQTDIFNFFGSFLAEIGHKASISCSIEKIHEKAMKNGAKSR